MEMSFRQRTRPVMRPAWMLLLIGPHKLAVCAAVGFILLQTHNKQTFSPAARVSLSGFTLAQQQLDIAVAAGENEIDFTLLCSFSCL